MGDHLNFQNPEGKEIQLQVHQLKSLNGTELKEVHKGDFVQIKYHSSVWVKSQAYK